MDDDEVRLGVFWGVSGSDGDLWLVAEHVPVALAEVYGDCLTFPEGHAEVWVRLQSRRDLPQAARALAYDAVPRGRLVYHRPSQTYWLYADRRLQSAAFVAKVVQEFGLIGRDVEVRSDAHYT